MNSNIIEFTDLKLDPLSELKKRFALSTIGGVIGIIDLDELQIKGGQKAPSLKIYSRADGRLLMERFLHNIPSNFSSKEVIKNFECDPKTKLFSNVAFSPLNVPSDTLNLWVGHSIKPAQGTWAILEKFIGDVVCNNNLNCESYFLDYLAHLFQKPEEKPGVMIALLSGQGAGKGTLFELIRKMFSYTTVQLNQVGHVVTGFNAILERSYIVLLDEAIFHSDFKSIEAMKSLITEPQITIEEKRQPRRTIQSHHRFIAATNSSHFAKTEKDDRRMIYFRLNESKVNDMGYWESVRNAINGPESQALAYHLINRDISSFNPRIRPDVDELVKQKLLSLQGFERFLYEVLTNEKIGFKEWKVDDFISTEHFINQYDEFRKGAARYNTIQAREIRNTMEKVLPSVRYGRDKKRGYELCHIDQARKDFERYMGGAIDWS
jgi:hypothetical protein